MQEQLNVFMISPSLAHSALVSQGLLRQGSGTASITDQWTVGLSNYTTYHCMRIHLRCIQAYKYK